VVEFRIISLADYNAIRRWQPGYFLPAFRYAVVATEGQTPYNAENAEGIVVLACIRPTGFDRSALLSWPNAPGRRNARTHQNCGARDDTASRSNSVNENSVQGHFDLTPNVHAHPESNYRGNCSSDARAEFLEWRSFAVDRGIGNMETAFPPSLPVVMRAPPASPWRSSPKAAVDECFDQKESHLTEPGKFVCWSPAPKTPLSGLVQDI
jgi:hypothetical protein